MHKRKKQKRWTQSDLEYLKNNYGKIPAKTIAEKLNRTYLQVSHKAYTIGLKSNLMKSCNLLSEQEINSRIEDKGFKLVDKYKGSHKKHLFICKYCKNGFQTQPTHILTGHTKSCGCVAIGRRKGTTNISGNYFRIIQESASQRNLKFEINIEYLEELINKQNFKCAISGITLICGYVDLRYLTMSLDRIDSSKGYIKGNVQWVHKDINMMKQNYAQNYFIELCLKVAQNQ